jgi:hypothetical protein
MLLPEEHSVRVAAWTIGVSACWLFAALPALARDAEPRPVEIPSGDGVPGAFSRLGEPERLVTATMSADGQHLAAAFLAGKEGEENRIAFTGPGPGEPSNWIVTGRVLVLRIDSGGRSVLALVERIRRKGRRSVTLDVFDTTEPDARPRSLNMPSSARGLAVRDGDGRIVVASQDDLRTFESGTLRSGRIYSIPGGNRSVAFLPGSERVLVGRDGGIWRVDLSAPQSREGMPVEARATAPGPVLEIAVSPRADLALARLEGDEILEVTVNPLQARATGRTARAIAWRGSAVPEPIEAVPEKPATQSLPPAPPAIESATPDFEEAGPSGAEQAPSSDAPSEIETPSPSLPVGQVAGRLVGPARGAAVSVRLLGPDNLLREARRVPVRPDGTWSVDSLAPGGYRVVVEAAGGGVLQCEPPFRTIRVQEGERLEVGPIEVVSVLR